MVRLEEEDTPGVEAQMVCSNALVSGKGVRMSVSAARLSMKVQSELRK